MIQKSEPQNHEALDEKFVRKFQKSLIATLSLSSKELFHSNMIAWLLKNHASFAEKFLNVDQPTKIEVEREKYNIDLLVTYRAPGDPQDQIVIVENKVKSLPDSDQVQRYKDKKIGHTGFIYLSLMDASDSFREKHRDVRLIGYKKISEWISESDKLQDPYHDALVRDYRDLIDSLLVIKAVAETPRDNMLGFTYTEEPLRKIRMFDVAQKIRYSLLADRCHKELEQSNILAEKGIEISNLIFEVSLTRSVGLVSVKLPLYKKDAEPKQHPILLMGIQIQGDQYRFFVESMTASDDVMPLSEALLANELWLNTGSNGKILKFNRNFRYTYNKIANLPIDQIASDVRKHIETLVNEQKKIKELIRLHLKPVS